MFMDFSYTFPDFQGFVSLSELSQPKDKSFNNYMAFPNYLSFIWTLKLIRDCELYRLRTFLRKVQKVVSSSEKLLSIWPKQWWHVIM